MTKRTRGARSDAGVSAIQKNIEKVYNLPKGSVQIQTTKGRNIRDDAKIRKVRKLAEG